MFTKSFEKTSGLGVIHSNRNNFPFPNYKEEGTTPRGGERMELTKSAGIPEMVGKSVGTTKRVGRNISVGFKNWRQDVAQRTRQASRAANVPNRAGAAGEALGSRRIAKETAKSGVRPSQEKGQAMKQQAAADVKSRKASMDKHKKDNKPSFAQKHPYLTAGGAFLAGRYAMSGGQQQQGQTQQPQVVYPQY